VPTYNFIPTPKNAIGSSGYAIGNVPFTGTNQTTTDYPIYAPDGSGKLISKNTGQPYNGVNPYDGKTYRGGVAATPPPGQQFIPGTTTAIDPNNPQQRYKPVDVTKNAPIADATTGLLDEFKKSAATSLNDFGKYLSDFKSQIGTANEQGKQATNIAPYVGAVTGAQTRYSGALDAAAAGAAQTNADVAAKEAALQAQARNDLGLYDTAQNNAQKLALDQLQKRVSRYKMAGSTPGSLGSDELAMLQAGARDISVPIELAKVNKRYDLTQGMDLPIAQADAARSAQFWQNFMPGVAGAQYSSASDVANEVQKLKMAVSGMSYDNAMRYMQSIGVPSQIQQQILSGQIGELGGLNQLYSGSRYQALQDVLGTKITQPVGYAPVTGGLPVSRYDVPNAPIQVSATPGVAGGVTFPNQYDPYGGGAVDPNAWSRYTNAANARLGGGTQSDIYGNVFAQPENAVV
jgi:hypothetical protein